MSNAYSTVTIKGETATIKTGLYTSYCNVLSDTGRKETTDFIDMYFIDVHDLHDTEHECDVMVLCVQSTSINVDYYSNLSFASKF